MNIAIDLTGLHLFAFQETKTNSDIPNLARVFRHHVIKFDQIKEFNNEGDTHDNFVIVSFNTSHIFLYVMMNITCICYKKYVKTIYF